MHGTEGAALALLGFAAQRSTRQLGRCLGIGPLLEGLPGPVGICGRWKCIAVPEVHPEVHPEGVGVGNFMAADLNSLVLL